MAQLNQEVQQLYSSLMDRMRQGTEMHEKLADYYNFLNLPGYQKCHEYHMLCELLTYQKAKDDYMKEFNQLVQPNYGNYTMMAANNSGNSNSGNNSGQNNSQMNMNGMSNMNNSANNLNNMMNNRTNYAQDVIPQNWYKYTRYDVDSNTKRQAVKDGFKKWLDYEKETKQFLVEMAKYLEQMGEREASRKLDYLIDDVEKEIEHAERKMISLENTNYDINYILQEQEPLKAKYAEKIRKLNMRDSQFRRRGMGNYANYNFDDDDDDEEEFGYNRSNYRRYMYDRYMR